MALEGCENDRILKRSLIFVGIALSPLIPLLAGISGVVSCLSPKSDGRSRGHVGMRRTNQARYPGEGAEQGGRSEPNSAERGGNGLGFEIEDSA